MADKDCDKAKIVKRNDAAILNAQKAMQGVAEQLGVKDDADVQALVDEVRYE